MLLSNLSLFGKAKLKLVSNVFPVNRAPILLLDKLEIGLREARVNQVSIQALSLPALTPDYCPALPETVAVTPVLDNRAVEDLTAWLRERLSYPEIEVFPMLLATPRKAGKSYSLVEPPRKQSELFEEDKQCVHALRRSWCSICIQKETQTREHNTTNVDLFDLIFPILQPPLGESFDSPIAFPPGKELYPFQRLGVKFLADHTHALLADEMGLGKSIQAIIAIRFLLRMGTVTSGLLLCPKTVLTDWQQKLWEWAPELKVLKVRGPKAQRLIYWNSPAHIHLTTYETWRQDIQDMVAASDNLQVAGDRPLQSLDDEEEIQDVDMLQDIGKAKFDFVILDEVQKIKNATADVSKAARLIDARIRWGLSGTPLENRLEDLISIFACLKPGLLKEDDVATPSRVKVAIRPYLLRRRKRDALPELPEKVCDEIWLELSPAQTDAYNRAEEEGIVELNSHGDRVTIQHVLALITKLKQICNLEPVSGESCKLEYLLEELEGISEQGDKALVFSQYPEKTLSFLQPELERFRPLVYHGSMSESQRDAVVTKFQREEENRVFLISVKAGGLGLTLTRANYVYHFDLWWNPSVSVQAEDRTHRIGQKKTVFVTSVLTAGTIEEKIQNMLNKKRELFKAIVDDLSDTNLSKVLTKEELFGLFKLAKPKADPGATGPKESWVQISPQEFENLVADLYQKMGYQVKVTPPSRDHGVDVYAKHQSDSGAQSLAIQCKHYPTGVVGVEHVRSLYGVIQAQPDLTKGVLCTSGHFSQECRKFAEDKRIDLFDGERLKILLAKYGLLVGL